MGVDRRGDAPGAEGEKHPVMGGMLDTVEFRLGFLEGALTTLRNTLQVQDMAITAMQGRLDELERGPDRWLFHRDRQ